MQKQEFSNCIAAEEQLKIHLSESLTHLKNFWSHQGYLTNIEDSGDGNPFWSKLLPIAKEFKKIILNEERELEQSKSEIQDYFLEIEELCSVLNRNIDEYLPLIRFCDNQPPYLIKPKLINNLTNLKNEISARRIAIEEAYNQSQLIGPEVYINPEFTNYSLTDVSSHVYNPIINEASRLSMIKIERINSFNISVSWIFHKWNTLSITPTEKDDIDIALEILFQSDLPNELNVESMHEHAPCCPDEKHLFYDWYSKVTEKDILNLSIPVIKILIKKSDIAIEVQNDNNQNVDVQEEELTEEETYEELKRLYRIGNVPPEKQENVLKPNGKIFSQKLSYAITEALQQINDNKETLHRDLLNKLEKLWKESSVSKENIEKSIKDIKSRTISLETLELMYNEYHSQKFQLENAPDIYDRICERKLIIDSLREYETNLSKESKDRFRGGSLNFKAEEKFYKENYPKLGRLEDSLIELIKLYESKYYKPFLFEGGHFLTILQSSIQHKKDNVEIIGTNGAACEGSGLRVDLHAVEKSNTNTLLQKPLELESEVSPSKATFNSRRLSVCNSIKLNIFDEEADSVEFDNCRTSTPIPKSSLNSRRSSIVSNSRLDISYDESDSMESDSCLTSSLILKSSSETLTIGNLISSTNNSISSVQNVLKDSDQSQLNETKSLSIKEKVQSKLITKSQIKINLNTKPAYSVKPEQAKAKSVDKPLGITKASAPRTPRTPTKTPVINKSNALRIGTKTPVNIKTNSTRNTANAPLDVKAGTLRTTTKTPIVSKTNPSRTGAKTPIPIKTVTPRTSTKIPVATKANVSCNATKVSLDARTSDPCTITKIPMAIKTSTLYITNKEPVVVKINMTCSAVKTSAPLTATKTLAAMRTSIPDAIIEMPLANKSSASHTATKTPITNKASPSRTVIKTPISMRATTPRTVTKTPVAKTNTPSGIGIRASSPFQHTISSQAKIKPIHTDGKSKFSSTASKLGLRPKTSMAGIGEAKAIFNSHPKSKIGGAIRPATALKSRNVQFVPSLVI